MLVDMELDHLAGGECFCLYHRLDLEVEDTVIPEDVEDTVLTVLPEDVEDTVLTVLPEDAEDTVLTALPQDVEDTVLMEVKEDPDMVVIMQGVHVVVEDVGGAVGRTDPPLIRHQW